MDKLYAKEQWDEIVKIGEKLFLDGTEDVKILNDLAAAYRRKRMIEDILLKDADQSFMDGNLETAKEKTKRTNKTKPLNQKTLCWQKTERSKSPAFGLACINNASKMTMAGQIFRHSPLHVTGTNQGETC